MDTDKKGRVVTAHDVESRGSGVVWKRRQKTVSDDLMSTSH